MDGADFVAMVDDFSAAGDEDVVAMNEEGAERFVLVLLVAKVFEVDVRRLGRTGRDGGERFGVLRALLSGVGMKAGAESAEKMLRPVPS